MAKKTKTSDLPGMTGPGVAPARIKEIEKLADAYIVERDKRCAMTPLEIAAKEKLLAAIHKHADKIGRDGNGSISYRYDDLVITVKPGKEKLQIKSATSDEDEDAD